MSGKTWSTSWPTQMTVRSASLGPPLVWTNPGSTPSNDVVHRTQPSGQGGERRDRIDAYVQRELCATDEVVTADRHPVAQLARVEQSHLVVALARQLLEDGPLVVSAGDHHRSRLPDPEARLCAELK